MELKCNLKVEMQVLYLNSISHFIVLKIYTFFYEKEELVYMCHGPKYERNNAINFFPLSYQIHHPLLTWLIYFWC